MLVIHQKNLPRLKQLWHPADGNDPESVRIKTMRQTRII